MKVKQAKKAILGRPPRISREEIEQTAYAMLLADQESLTIRNLAERLGTSQPAIYLRFKNKDALMEALAERALADFWVECDTTLPWRQALERWHNQSRALMLAKPAVIQLIQIAAASPAMMANLERLAKVIQQAGFSRKNAAVQAQSLLWSLLAYVFSEIQAGDPALVERFQENDQHGEYGKNFFRHMAIDRFDELWSATVARHIAGIAALGKQRGKASDI